jgi:hypothetical protein
MRLSCSSKDGKILRVTCAIQREFPVAVGRIPETEKGGGWQAVKSSVIVITHIISNRELVSLAAGLHPYP